jgi:uncharacterized metal-binding protein YceD (DUF177 family)
MSKTNTPPRPLSDWTLALHEVPASGLHYNKTIPETDLKALARLIGVDKIASAALTLHLTPEGREGLHGTGDVRASVTQTCVVSLDPVDAEIHELIDVSFKPLTEEDIRRRETFDPDEDENLPDPPEPVDNGRVDIGQLTIEFLAVGVDPYPRIEGAVFNPPPEDADEGPFAALKALKDKS